MFYYYLALALRSLRRNVVLTSLMVAAIGVGIGASMTTLTVFRAMAADPIPEKSSRLFAPQIDNWGPQKRRSPLSNDGLQPQITYEDAVALMKAKAAFRQTAMYRTGLAVTPPNPDLLPFQVQVRATYGDFFKMFDVPFLFGSPWSGSDDEDRADIVVISRQLNDKLFDGANSVGKTLNLDGRSYRIVGVIDRWQPIPRFYDLNESLYGLPEEVYLPFTTAINSRMEAWGNTNCSGENRQSGWEGRLRSECVWIQFWVELPSDADAARYRAFLNHYAEEQRRLGRFNWPAHTKLRDVKEWLVYQKVVSDESRILVLVSFSFLFVCLLNAMGLMLAKIMGRAGDIGVRRALGANRYAIFGQCLIEAGVIGVAGGLVGLVLTALGLLGARSLLSEDIGRLTHIGLADILIAMVLSIGATVLAGLYPTWRAAHVQPAWQLKTQ